MPATPKLAPTKATPKRTTTAPALPAALVDRIGALPAGALVEREAIDRWRVHVRGVERYGHGATFAAALADYLGEHTAAAASPAAVPAAASASVRGAKRVRTSAASPAGSSARTSSSRKSARR